MFRPAAKVAVKPLLSDPLELPEQVQLRVFAGVAPLVHDEMRGQLVQDL